MTNHSKEPWTVEIQRIEGAAPDAVIRHASAMMKDYPVAHISGEVHCNAVDDAARIVACVNACKGIPTKDLEDADKLLPVFECDYSHLPPPMRPPPP